MKGDAIKGSGVRRAPRLGQALGINIRRGTGCISTSASAWCAIVNNNSKVVVLERTLALLSLASANCTRRGGG